MFVPETPVLTQVRLTPACVQPVVRPTLLTVSPTNTFVDVPTTLLVPVTVMLLVFGALVMAMAPSVEACAAEYSARELSLYRHRLPRGHAPCLKYVGSSTSVA